LQAVRDGAQDYLVKGQIDANLLARSLRYAVERKRAELALRASEERYRGLVEVGLAATREQQTEGLVFHGMVSRHPQFLQNLAIVRKVADARVPVLVRGESGTGKELIARALHDSSRRRDKPLVVINCAAVPETLLEAELFGIQKGVATGVAERPGKLLLADTGTAFLDEVGDMPITLQTKLLRFLQDGLLQPVGGRCPLKTDVRVVAATNKDIEQMLEQGTFRKDLYYRLNTIELTMPPLRGRPLDIRDFTYFFIEHSNQECGRSVTGISGAALGRLVAYDWPGNVRQLQNVVARAVLMTDGDTIELTDLPEELRPAGSTPLPGPVKTVKKAARDAASSDVEKRMIVACLEQADWNVAAAARLAGYSRVHLHRLMAKYGIQRPQKRPSE
jgi:transcriptional regulator with PAS, ATPase and Fis domain